MSESQRFPSPKTPAQNRKIWATAHQLGLEEPLLRDLVESVTGQRSISGLAFRQAQDVIRELEGQVSERRRQHRRVGPPSARISPGQLNYIYDLVGQSKFADLWAFRAWLKRYFKVGHENWLNNKNAVKVITALKSMRDRHREST